MDIIEEINRSLTGANIEYAKACNEGHTITNPLMEGDREYSIEAVVRKLG